MVLINYIDEFGNMTVKIGNSFINQTMLLFCY